ncbi:uncharacterized protein [Macrobrachium rosenbergii]|uniref:uncharacterized protein n=1 Tax=Macrobrachium rosenbergii TaxID=79674 RepID=UPI0034D775D6
MISSVKDLSTPGPSDGIVPAQMTTTSPAQSKSSMEMDNSQDNPNNPNQSGIKTLIPYRTPKKSKYRHDPTLTHFDSLFGSGSWSRFLTMEADQNISALKLENYLLNRHPTTDMSFRQIKEKTWLIEATTKSQSEDYLSLKNIDSINIKVKNHNTMNSIQGTIVLNENNNEPVNKKMLLDSLKKRYPNVQDCEVYALSSKNNNRQTLKIAKITFEGEDLPQKIKILGQNRELRPYVPKPLQCQNCSKYGHTHTNCRNEPVCAYCGSTEHTMQWKCSEPKCVNCGQNHHARSKECMYYIYNTELKMLQERTGMSIKEAKLELKVRGMQDPSKKHSYSSITRAKNEAKAETDRNNREQKSKSQEKINNLEIKNKMVKNKETGTNEMDNILSNSFEILMQIETQEDAATKVTEEGRDRQEIKDKKRPLERTPPKMKKPNINRETSVKPKGKGDEKGTKTKTS